MEASHGISAGDLLLSRFKGRGLKLCVRLGIAMSTLAFLPAAVSTDDRGRRVAAAALLLACWFAAEYFRNRSEWIPDVLADRRWVLAAAAFTTLPYAIDGHAQVDAFMGIAPLAGVAAVVCRRREVIVFAAISIAAYVVGVAVGGGGLNALADSEHPFDATQQIAAIGACCGLFAFGVLGFRRFIDRIPEVVAGATGAKEKEGEKEGENAGGVEQLTDREREVLELLMVGQKAGEIAKTLIVSPETVKTHIKKLRRKLGASSQAEAVAIYSEKRHRDE